MRKPWIHYSLSICFIFIGSFLAWQGFYLSFQKAHPIIKKKLPLKEEMNQLIQSFNTCSKLAEPYICSRLQSLSHLNFAYEHSQNRNYQKKIVTKWVEWWQRNKTFSPKEWLSRAVVDEKYPSRVHGILEMEKFKAYPKGIQALLKIYEDSNSSVSLKKESLHVLGTWKSKEGLACFQDALDSEDVFILLEAIRGLGKLRKNFQEVLPFLQHSSSRVREQASESLFLTAPNKSLKIFPALLKDPAINVRMFILSILKENFSSKKIKELIQKHVVDFKIKKSLLNLVN